MKRIRIFALTFLTIALLLILIGVVLILKENSNNNYEQKLDTEVESNVKNEETSIVHCVKENVTENFVYTHSMDITLTADNKIMYYTLEVKTKCSDLKGYNEYKKVEVDNNAIITYDDTNLIISKKYVNKKLYDVNNQEAVVSYDNFKSNLVEQLYTCDK